MRYLWRTVDYEGEVLESFVTKERDKSAALKFMYKVMKRHGCAKSITTGGLRQVRASSGTPNGDEPKALHDAGAEPFDQSVRRAAKPAQRRNAVLGFQVQSQ